MIEHLYLRIKYNLVSYKRFRFLGIATNKQNTFELTPEVLRWYILWLSRILWFLFISIYSYAPILDSDFRSTRMYHPISSILTKIVFPGISRSRFGNILVKPYDSRQKYSDWDIEIFRYIQIFDKRSWISLRKHLNFHLEYDGDIVPCFHGAQGSLGYISPDLIH